MWRSLVEYADTEVEASTEAVKLSFDKLDAAAKELQQRVKELLADYHEGDAGERGSMAASRTAGGDGEELGHAARSLAHLCAQPPRAEEGTAPGTIFTPRGPQAGAIIPNEAGLSVVAGANKLKALLLADVPALRWNPTAGPGAAAGTGPRLQQAYLRGGPSQRLAAKLNVTVDVDPAALDDTLTALQDYCRETQAEACAELRELQTLDASPLHVYSHLLQQALGAGRAPGPDELAWNWVPPQGDNVAKARQLLLVVVHSSRSATDAWAALTDALMHDMALPDVEASRMLGPRAGGRGQSGSAGFVVTLDSYRGLLAELEHLGDQWLVQRVETRDVQPEGPAAGNRVEEGLAVIKSNLMPRTYLQMVGQKLLYHAAPQVPCMTQLPERIPDWTLRTLYGRPFAEAVKLALQAALASPSTPGSCAAASSQQPAAGGKLPRTLPRTREEGRRQGGESSQQPASSSGRGVAAGLAGADVAGAVGSSAPGGTSGGEAEVAAVEHARAAVTLVAEVCRDVLAFEEGFSAILRRAAPAPTDQPGTAPPPPSLHPHPHLQCDLPYTAAAAYLSVLRDEVSRVMRDVRPALQGAICGNVTSAVQACLSDGNLQQPPRPVAVTSDIWPTVKPPIAGDAQGPGGSGSNTEAPRLVDDASHRVLSFASWLHGRARVEDFPGPLQVVLWGALLECLSALMDHLSSICTTLREMPAEPLTRLLLFRSAAACVRQRLEACAPALGRASLPLHHHDELQLALVQQHGECLVQADELVSSIHQHILMAHQDVVQSVVLASLDRTDWCAFRPEVMRGAKAGPGVRVWHCLMLRWLRAAVHHSSLHDAEWIVGQVLQDGLVSQMQRYLQLCPSAQMLREYVADAVHIVATVFLLCQPLKVSLPAPSQVDVCLRVPYPMVAALSATAQELLIRAALLHVPGSTLVELARKVGLCPSPDNDATSPSRASSSSPLPAPVTAPSQPQPQPPALAAASAAASLTSAPGVIAPWPSLPLPPLGSTPPASEAGLSLPLPGPASPASRHSGAGGGIRLEPLPAVHVQRASLSTERRSAGPVGEGEVPAGSSHDPTHLQTPLPADASAAVSSTHDDDKRLALWSSWLPYDIVQSLKREAEGLGLDGAPCATQLMPLGDRMADPGAGGGGANPPSRLNPPADGRAWRLCLEHVARHHASRRQVLLALARRQELHAALGNEPVCDMESRRVVRRVARQLGLLLEQGPAGGDAD